MNKIIITILLLLLQVFPAVTEVTKFTTPSAVSGTASPRDDIIGAPFILENAPTIDISAVTEVTKSTTALSPFVSPDTASSTEVTVRDNSDIAFKDELTSISINLKNMMAETLAGHQEISFWYTNDFPISMRMWYFTTRLQYAWIRGRTGQASIGPAQVFRKDAAISLLRQHAEKQAAIFQKEVVLLILTQVRPVATVMAATSSPAHGGTPFDNTNETASTNGDLRNMTSEPLAHLNWYTNEFPHHHGGTGQAIIGSA